MNSDPKWVAVECVIVCEAFRSFCALFLFGPVLMGDVIGFDSKVSRELAVMFSIMDPPKSRNFNDLVQMLSLRFQENQMHELSMSLLGLSSDLCGYIKDAWLCCFHSSLSSVLLVFIAPL